MDKKNIARFLQLITILVGIATFIFMLWEPTVEGRNLHSTLFEIYFNDGFLAYAYTASIFFFTVLYQIFKLLGYVGQNEIFSQQSVKSLRIIKNCATTLVVFALGAEYYLFIVQPGDDIAGGVFMGLLMIAISGTIAIVATRFEKSLLEKGVNG